MNTNKKAVRLIAEVCRQKGIRKVVFSPGSRLAPLFIAFSRIPEMECMVIPDERVAGYFALGLAQQLRQTVAVVCTSGTAVANLFPAVIEAYYQQVSLLIITADRPAGAVDRSENQAIEQEEFFEGYAYGISVDGDEEAKEKLNEIVDRVNRRIIETVLPVRGCMHVNVRMNEPLYETTGQKDGKLKIPVPIYREDYRITLRDQRKIRENFQYFRNKMVIVGDGEHPPGFVKALKKLNRRKDVAIIHENLSGLNIPDSVSNIDGSLAVLPVNEIETFVPDLVITFGNRMVSKKIKQFLKDKPKLHWDIPLREAFVIARKMFGEMFDLIQPVSAKQFLEIVLSVPENKESTYKNDWLALGKKAQAKSQTYFSQLPFSDLKVFETLVKSFPSDSNIQYGNSTPIRYSNFFPHNKSLTINANRGASGIDGCVSTAAGAAYANKRMTISVVGDQTFFYDSNALWNNYLSPDFRIIIINNGGGNIFRLLDGATKLKDFEKFFEAKHHLTAKHLAAMYDLPYYICASQKELDKALKTFYMPQKGKAAILEIMTDGKLSAEVYRKYFEYLRQEKE